MAVALRVLVEVAQRGRATSGLEPSIAPGTIFRYIGRHTPRFGRYKHDPTHDTEPVIFLCSPFLHLPELRKSQIDNDRYHQTLLEYLYGSVAGSMRKAEMGAQQVRLGEDPTPRTFHVSNFWSLMIGSSQLLTRCRTEESLKMMARCFNHVLYAALSRSTRRQHILQLYPKNPYCPSNEREAWSPISHRG